MDVFKGRGKWWRRSLWRKYRTHSTQYRKTMEEQDYECMKDKTMVSFLKLL